MKMKEIKMPDINIKVGQTTEVELKSIAASTGYSWVLVHKPDCLWLDDINYIYPEPPIPGKAGKVVFVFTGAAKCQDYVQFAQVRHWDLEDMVQKITYALIITE